MTVQTNTSDRTRFSSRSDLLDLNCNAETPLLDALKLTLAASIVFAGMMLVLVLAAGHGLA